MAVRKLGRGVAIVGAGMSRFGAFPDKAVFVERGEGEAKKTFLAFEPTS